MSNEIELFSISAEQSVLGGLMLDGDAMDHIGALSEGDFYREDHRRIFAAIRSLSAAGKPCDLLSVFDALESSGQGEKAGGIAYLADMANGVLSVAGIRRHAEIIRDRATQRRILATAAEVQEVVTRFDRTTAEKLDFAQAAFAKLTDADAEKAAPQDMASVLYRHTLKLEKRREGEEVGLSTGFSDLDARLSGGMREGQLILIAARPAMGKTALALQIAAHCATAGTATLFCSQEMAETDLADRLLCLQGRIPVERVISGHLTPEDWDRVIAATGMLHQAPLYLDEQPALTLQDVRNKARQVKRKAGSLGLLVVDYLQLMTGDGANRNSEIEEISRGLKRLAKEMRMPVIALSQLNRGVEQRPNKRPMLSDLRDSGAIEQDADVVMSVYRDEIYDPASPNKGCAEIGMLKVRQGRAGGFVPMAYVGEYVRFESFAGQWAQSESKPRGRRTFDD